MWHIFQTSTTGVFVVPKKQTKPLVAELAPLSVVIPAVFLRDSMAEQDLHPLFRRIDEVSLLARTLLCFEAMPFVREIILVICQADFMRINELCRHFSLTRLRQIICSDTPGLMSLRAGVYATEHDSTYIAAHDPLRPFLTAELAEKTLLAAMHGNAAAPALPVTDTIKIVQDNRVYHTPERATLYTLQTPQIVEGSLLKAAIEQATMADSGTIESDTATDLQAILANLGLPLNLTQGCQENIAIRTPMDISAGEVILARRSI